MDRVADQPATRAIGEVLLDQRVAAGIGNIWRCESLFVCGLDPRTPIGDVDPDDVLRVYQVARDLMRRSVDDTHRPPDKHVHDRAGQGCMACGSRIAVYLLGDRHAYSCPRCQPYSRPR
jgi:endonuclease-8